MLYGMTDFVYAAELVEENGRFESLSELRTFEFRSTITVSGNSDVNPLLSWEVSIAVISCCYACSLVHYEGACRLSSQYRYYQT